MKLFTRGIGFAGAWLAAFSCAHAEADLTGVWQVKGNGVDLIAAAIEAPVFTPEGASRYEKNKVAIAQRELDVDKVQRCASPGLPRIMMLPYPFEIMQQSDFVAMLFEWNQLFRQIPIEGKRSLYTLPSAMGFSSGHWEGDTLVVATTDRTGSTLLDNTGLPNSEELKITERLRLRKNGRVLEDRITIADPQNYRKPWEAVIEFERRSNVRLKEDVCLDRVVAGQAPIETPAERRKAR